MVWHPAFNVWFIAAVGAVLFLALTRSVFGSETIARPWARFFAWLLRVGALSLVILILLNPVRQEVESAPARDSLNLVLVDTSESMALERPTSRLQQALTWASAVEQATPSGGQTRLIGFGADVDFKGPSGISGASTRLAYALRRVLESNPGQRLASVMVVSDGRIHDREALGAALELARQRRVPIFTHVVGRDEAPRNVFISACRVERSAPSGARIPVSVDIGATGVNEGTELDVSIKDELGKIVASAPVKVRAGRMEQQLVFVSGLRTSAYTVSVARADRELTYADNDFTFTLDIADPKIRVLYCEGSTDRITEMGGAMWNSSELMPTAWKRAGDIDADTFATRGGQTIAGRTLTLIKTWRDHEIVFDVGRGLPDTREGWQEYDVVISSDVQRANFTPQQLQWVVEMVAERGAGFCMIGGMTSFDVGKWQQTVWEKLVPVQMADQGFGHKWTPTFFVFPPEVRQHPILQMDADPARSNRILDAHPKLLGLHDIRRAKPGATVLANRKGANAPLVVTQPYGKGRTMAYLSDPTGGWGVEYQGKWGPALLPGESQNTGPDRRALAPNEYYNRFWTNVARWLAGNSVRRWHKEILARTELLTYRPGQIVKVAATLPALSDPAQVARESVGARLALDAQPRVPLQYDRDRKEFVGQFTLPESIAGDEVTVIFDSPTKGEVRTDDLRLRIMHLDREMETPAPDAQLLADIAKVSGGEVLQSPEDAAAVMRKQQRVAAGESVPFIEPRWNQWPLWASLLGVLGLEWLLRRLAA